MIMFKDMRGIFATLLLLIGVEGYVAWAWIDQGMLVPPAKEAPARSEESLAALYPVPGHVLGVPVANPVLSIHMPEQSVFAPEGAGGV